MAGSDWLGAAQDRESWQVQEKGLSPALGACELMIVIVLIHRHLFFILDLFIDSSHKNTIYGKPFFSL